MPTFSADGVNIYYEATGEGSRWCGATNSAARSKAGRVK